MSAFQRRRVSTWPEQAGNTVRGSGQAPIRPYPPAREAIVGRWTGPVKDSSLGAASGGQRVTPDPRSVSTITVDRQEGKHEVAAPLDEPDEETPKEDREDAEGDQ